MIIWIGPHQVPHHINFLTAGISRYIIFPIQQLERCCAVVSGWHFTEAVGPGKLCSEFAKESEHLTLCLLHRATGAWKTWENLGKTAKPAERERDRWR